MNLIHGNSQQHLSWAWFWFTARKRDISCLRNSPSVAFDQTKMIREIQTEWRWTPPNDLVWKSSRSHTKEKTARLLRVSVPHFIAAGKAKSQTGDVSPSTSAYWYQKRLHLVNYFSTCKLKAWEPYETFYGNSPRESQDPLGKFKHLLNKEVISCTQRGKVNIFSLLGRGNCCNTHSQWICLAWPLLIACYGLLWIASSSCSINSLITLPKKTRACY